MRNFQILIFRAHKICKQRLQTASAPQTPYRGFVRGPRTRTRLSIIGDRSFRVTDHGPLYYQVVQGSMDCRTCMEQSPYQHHSINLFAIFQETT